MSILNSPNLQSVDIDLSQELSDSLYFQLKDIDSAGDNNDLVTLDEACEQTVNLRSGSVDVCTNDDLAFLQKMIDHENSTSHCARFGKASAFQSSLSDVSSKEFETDAWLFDLERSGALYDDPISFIASDSVTIEITHAKPMNDGYKLLLKLNDIETDNYFFSTFYLTNDPEKYSFEVNGTQIPFVCDFTVQNNIERQILFLISHFLYDSNTTVMPASEKVKFSDAFETQLVKNGVLSFTNPLVLIERFRNQKRVDESVKTRYEQSCNREFPVWDYLEILGDKNIGFVVPVVAEKELSKEIIASLANISDILPSELIMALHANGVMDTLYIEIMEDDVFDYRGSAIAQYDADLNRVIIGKSVLFTAVQDSGLLNEILLHELSHAIFANEGKKAEPNNEWDAFVGLIDRVRLGGRPSGEASDTYFIQGYLARIKDKAIQDGENQFVSYYSLTNSSELFAECSTAYLTGEEDFYIFDRVDQGPKSRSELREKMPEMYMALKLFYEPESPLYGSLYAFSSNNYQNIVRLIEEYPEILEPNISMSWVKTVYQGVLKQNFSFCEQNNHKSL